MRKPFTLIFAVVVSIAILSGCGKEPESISYFKYTQFDDYKTTASEVEKTNNVYIAGQLLSTEIKDIDGAPYLIANVQEGKDKNWICVIGQAGEYSDTVLADYFGKKVRCFGDYNGKIDGSPSLKLSEKSDEYCINDANNGIIATNETLKASADYARNWFDSNADEVIYSEAFDEEKTGSYKSTGIIDSFYAGETINTLSFIQKKGDTYYSSLINESFWDEPIESFLNKYDEGDAITVYFVIDEDGHAVPLCYNKARVDFSLDDYENETAPDVLVEKTYDWDDSGTIKLKLTKNKTTGDLGVSCEAEANSLEKAAIGVLFFFYVFEHDDTPFAISMKVNNSKASYHLIGKDGEIQVAFGYEEDGTYAEPPSWILNTEDTNILDDSISKELKDIVRDFTEEMSNLS